jgi:hypothetical protein
MKQVEELYSQLAETRKQTLELLEKVIIYNMTFIEEDEDPDRFYEFPSTIYTDKHGYSCTYYIYKVEKENGMFFFTGKDMETDDDFEFEVHDLTTQDLLQIIELYY